MEKQREQPFNIAPVLVALLVLSSNILGMLWTKVSYLEKKLESAVPPAQVVAAAAPSEPQAAQPTQPAAPKQAAKTPEVTGDDYYRGAKDAKIILVEYSDLECPFCKRFHPTMKQAMKEYGDKIKWVWRHYPLNFHANAQKEAEAAECAGKLGGNTAFWKYIDAILERTTSNGTGFALRDLVPLAKEQDLAEAKFQACLDDGEFEKKVKDQMKRGQEEGVSGTPGTIIIDAKGDTQLIPGALPFEQVKPMIDTALDTL